MPTKRTLEVMSRMRRLVVEDARQHLAGCLAAETSAAAARHEAASALAREHDAATDPDATDQAVEAYAAWLPRGRARLDVAEAALSRAEAASGQARAQLGAARAAEEAVQRRVAAVRAAERAEVLFRDQAALDEAAARTRRATLPDSGEMG
jgi:hypothetical protein